MTEPIRTCINCGSGVPSGARVCPNCGANVPPEPSLAPTPPAKLATGRGWLDVVLGIFLGLFSYALFGVGAVVGMLVYFSIKPTYPVLARALGWTLLVPALLLAGAFMICTGCAIFGGM